MRKKSKLKERGFVFNEVESTPTPARRHSNPRLRANGAAKDGENDHALADDYVVKIKASWQKSVESILETGRLLIEAKKALKHGQWQDMIDEKLPFGERTAEMLRIIAEHPVVANPKHVSVLPASWGTLHAIAKLPVEEPELEKMLTDGTIHAGIQRKDVENLQHQIERVGIYSLDQVPILLDKLMKFTRQYEPERCVAKTVDALTEDGKTEFTLEELGALSSWISQLHAACLQRMEEDGAREHARDAAEGRVERERLTEAATEVAKVH